MQIKSLRIKSYRSWPIADNASTEAIARIKKLELYEQLKSEGCSAVLRLQAIGWSKATYYRWLKRYRQQGWSGMVGVGSAKLSPSKHSYATVDKTA